MSARIVPGRAEPWETRQPFMIECLDCGIEWYWGYEHNTPGIIASRDKHNEEHHND